MKSGVLYDLEIIVAPNAVIYNPNIGKISFTTLGIISNLSNLPPSYVYFDNVSTNSVKVNALFTNVNTAFVEYKNIRRLVVGINHLLFPLPTLFPQVPYKIWKPVLNMIVE